MARGPIVAEQDKWVSQIRKGVVELAVLGLLSRERMYGSQLVDELSAHEELAISVGTVYPLLSRLKKSGVIDSVWEESPVGPPRKYYRLTAAGSSQLAEMSAGWHSVSRAIDGLLGPEVN
jgi:PadR family transcriptional regulator, regulatory protein PadR